MIATIAVPAAHHRADCPAQGRRWSWPRDQETVTCECGWDTAISLEQVLEAAPDDHVPAPGFRGFARRLIGDDDVGGGTVTAVLELTAVVELGEDDRRLARIADVLVVPGEIEWQPKPPKAALMSRGRQRDPEERVALRAASDRRARRDQARIAVVELAEPPATREAADEVEPVDAPAALAGVVVTEAAPGAADPAPPELVDVGDQVADRAAEDDVAGPRLCARCDRPIPRQNRRGICTPCQAVCPGCEGPKAIQAEMCKTCSQQEPIGPADEALAAAEALADLPTRVQELLDQIVTLARYARDLEDALDHQQAELRALRRSVAGALARSVA
jgi:hypothetical protein